MTWSLAAYQNQVIKQQQIRELMFDPPAAPVLLPCFTIFRRACKMGRKMVGIAYPLGALQFFGFYDDMDAVLN